VKLTDSCKCLVRRRAGSLSFSLYSGVHTGMCGAGSLVVDFSPPLHSSTKAPLECCPRADGWPPQDAAPVAALRPTKKGQAPTSAAGRQREGVWFGACVWCSAVMRVSVSVFVNRSIPDSSHKYQATNKGRAEPAAPPLTSPPGGASISWSSCMGAAAAAAGDGARRRP
jgi:hypothetical protein